MDDPNLASFAAGGWTPAALAAFASTLQALTGTPQAPATQTQAPGFPMSFPQLAQAHSQVQTAAIQPTNIPQLSQVAARHVPQVVPPPPFAPGYGANNEKVLLRQQKEEEMKRRQQDLQRKRSEEQQLREQHKASIIVRKVIQRVRIARPENIDELRAELEQAQSEQLEAMGDLAEKVQQEAERALLDAQQRVTQEAEKQMEEERKRFEKDMLVREEEARVEALGQEAAQDVREVEVKITHASELAKPFTEGDLDSSPEGVLEAVEVTEEALEAAQAEFTAVQKSIREKWSQKGDSDVAMAKLGPQFRQLHQRLGGCRKELEALKKTSMATRERVTKKMAVMKKDREQRELFAKYDSDGDGKLSRNDVAFFAKVEYEFELSEEQLDKIFVHIVAGGGVPFESFPKLRSMLGITRSEVRERARREEEIKRKREIDEERRTIREAVGRIAEHLVEAEGAIARCNAAKLSNRGFASLSPAQMKALAESVGEETQPARDALSEALSHIADLEVENEDDDPTLLAYQRQEVSRIRSRAARVQEQLDAISASAESARAQYARKAYAELSSIRIGTATAMCEFMSAKSLTIEQLFDHIKGEDGVAQYEQFESFLKSLPTLHVEAEQSEKLFEHVTGGTKELTFENLQQVLRLSFKVGRSTMLTTDLPINSKVARRLDAGEVLELLEGPTKDPGIGIYRVRCRSMLDGEEGWVTMVGNQGTVFIEPISTFYIVVKETAITEGLSVRESRTLRQLLQGEFVEALGVQEEDVTCGAKRFKCKAVRRGTIGWVTLVGNQGTTFLEHC